ncbi:cytochrome c oxidase accessory protein CcoG [Curvibacter sp. HBC61]|uniref:Cytochrome c oxidase accessory protein CcoG n=1 Tax=Curvibacter cyanobacteriorum TaxID=3026422 RepID=A0ABT5N2I5_9BURK|nr:cytochrome c oxidase accessory protein CcoG [Curvibacter sp. HBC61]MDD0839736.1 cytochrome c oxidase accessory protein CcoG [Curvibacter sp. HBC61]
MTPTPHPPKVIPIVAAPADDTEVFLYAASKKIHPRSVSGLFARWRWSLVFLTQIVFYGLPWLEWGQRQAILFDLEARRFYLLGIVLYPQDFIYLTGLLVISALSLFLFTAVAGRLWCGYACPQTVYTEIFLWIERRFEGDRMARIRLDDAPWSLQKLGRRGGKHLVWLLVALWTGFTFVGYFTPIQTLALEVVNRQLGPWETFWVVFYGFATYGNAGFMREQVCKYMCPYARFQSAMFDKDTLIVTYDEARGEPRGKRLRKTDPAAIRQGACVDCELCVQVCPTGIDIRKGLQYECIGCGACADVCDTVMDKLSYPRGLIRYATQNAIKNGWSQAQILRRILRPRVLIYSAILLTLTGALFSHLMLRTPLRVDVVRDRAALSRIVPGGMLENVYRLQVMNATETTQVYRIGATGLDGLKVASDELVTVGPAESRWVPVRLQLPYGSVASGSHPVYFEIGANGDSAHVSEKSVFLVPR